MGEALAGWALPIAGVRATPKYYTEAEYYAAPVDEVRTYPVYTNNRLVPVAGFAPFVHPSSPPTSDVMRTRAGPRSRPRVSDAEGHGVYKVPSLKGLSYRGPLEHSGSIATLEEWFDPARLRDDYRPKGWNPPDTRVRPIPGHQYGLDLAAEDKRALIAFLKTL